MTSDREKPTRAPRDGAPVGQPPAGGEDAGRGAVATALGREVKSALARWVLHKQRDRRGARAADPHDEATHAWDGRRRFAEDYTFIAVQADWALLLRLEWLPGRDRRRVWVTLLRPDRVDTIAGGQSVVAAGAAGATEAGDPWRVAGLELDCLEPYRSWALRYVGRLHRREPGSVITTETQDDATGSRASVDLTFMSEDEPFAPGIDDDPDLIARHLGEASWDASLYRTVRRSQHRGYVQTGMLVGTLALGDSLMPVRAKCLRQHNWGVRDWGASDTAFQCFAALDDGTQAFVHHARFPFVTLEGGFVSGLGRTRQTLRSIGTSVERRPRRAPAHASLHLEHTGGATDLQLEMVSDATMLIDGRGELALGLFSVEGGGQGLWAGQRRALPRRGRPQRS